MSDVDVCVSLSSGLSKLAVSPLPSTRLRRFGLNPDLLNAAVGASLDSTPVARVHVWIGFESEWQLHLEGRTAAVMQLIQREMFDILASQPLR